MMNWITLTVISSLITSGNSILDKWLATKQCPHPWLSATSFALVGAPVAGIGLWLLPAASLSQVAPAILAGIIFMAAAWLYYATVGQEEISRLTPLFRFGVILDWGLAAVFLGDCLTTKQMWACLVLLGSTLCLSLKFDGGHRLSFSRGALRILLVTLLLSINSILTANVYRSVSLWHGIVWEKVGLLIGLLIGTLWFGTHTPRLYRQLERRTWGVLLTEQTIRFVTGLAPAWAVAGGVPLVLPSLLGGARYIAVWILAVIMLKEPLTRHDALFKGVGIVGMALGTLWAA